MPLNVLGHRQETNELGGQDYQHQSRTGATFDRHIDDFSIAIISLSIGALIHHYFKGDNLPVETVSWDDIMVFCNELNQLTAPHYIFSLPTKAQWEYAARATNS